MKKMISFALSMVLQILLCLKVYAYDSNVIHPRINEMAALKSANFISMLRSWGYQERPPKDILDSNVITGKEIKRWLRDGGTEEDNGIRWLNHFHDPTKEWDKAGLGGSSTRYSSLLWAQNKQPYNSLLATNEWAWPAARSYYYHALTAQTKTLRERDLSYTLKSLGQVMHLLADAAVPEHVRDDQHALGSEYEEWCGAHEPMFTNISENAVSYSIANTALVPGLIPISNFWDSTPAPGYNTTFAGLAEYTNFNFVSPDTIFKDYTYPQRPNHFIESVIAEDGVQEKVIYFKGTTSDGKPINHLASTGYTWAELSQISANNMNDSRFKLDDNCFKDYADILVPKAVSYDAGLLDYFFRGDISLDPTDTTDQYTIRNNSATESMTGTLGVYYDDDQGNRILAGLGGMDNPNTNFTLAANANSAPFMLTPQTSPSPKEKGKYILAFKGTMGNEAAVTDSQGNIANGAVVGRVKKWWREEWDRDFTGNHAWKAYTNVVEMPPTDTTIRFENGALVQENVRPANQQTTQQQEASLPGSGQDLPRAITKDSWIEIKIDEMSSTVSLPLMNCYGCTDCNAAYQGITFYFDNGYSLMVTTAEQTPSNSFFRYLPATHYYRLTPLSEAWVNIFALFEFAGVSFHEPVNLTGINVQQRFEPTCDGPTTSEQRQKIVVDFIRIEN